MDRDGFTVHIPDDLSDAERSAYLRGLKDMAEYFQRVSWQAQAVYNDELTEADDGPDHPCPECGEETHYNPASGDRHCFECES